MNELLSLNPYPRATASFKEAEEPKDSVGPKPIQLRPLLTHQGTSWPHRPDASNSPKRQLGEAGPKLRSQGITMETLHRLPASHTKGTVRLPSSPGT